MDIQYSKVVHWGTNVASTTHLAIHRGLNLFANGNTYIQLYEIFMII